MPLPRPTPAAVASRRPRSGGIGSGGRSRNTACAETAAKRHERRAEERICDAGEPIRGSALRTDHPTVAVLLALEAHRRRETPETIQAVTDAVMTTNRDGLVVSRPALINDAACGGAPGIIPFPTMGTTFETALVDGRFTSRDTLTGELTDGGPPPAPCAVGGRTDTVGFAAVARRPSRPGSDRTSRTRSPSPLGPFH